MYIKKVIGILLLGFILRIILLIVNTYYVTLPQGGFDAVGFEKQAYLIYTSGYSNLDYVYYFSSGARLLELLGSFVYCVTGREPLFLGLIMVFLGCYSILLGYKAAYLLWNSHKYALTSAWLIALFPLLMLHSAIFLREIPINVLLLLSIISFIRYWKDKNKKYIFSFLFYVFFASLFHSGLSFILVGLGYYVIFFTRKVRWGIKLMTLLLLISSLFIMNSTGFGLNKLGGSFDKSLELFQERENYELKGNSAYPPWLMLSRGLNDLWKIPLRNITFLFSPLVPFIVSSLWHVIGVLDALLYLFMFYVLYKRRRVFKLNDTAKAIIVMMLFTVFIFSLGVSNVGTAIRHRAKIAPILIVVFSGVNQINLKRN